MSKQYSYPSVLTIAGSDGSGGAGFQGDIKTISAIGCFATTAITALPVQNTMGVQSIYPIPITAVGEQIDAIFEDITPNAIKIGMVHHTTLAQLIAQKLRTQSNIPVVFDPVMVANSGDRLIEEDTVQSLIVDLFPLATIITPNLDEAALLIGAPIDSVAAMYEAGEQIMKLGCKSLLLKGAHLATPINTSLFFDVDGTITQFDQERYDTNNTHGSGCTLSSAIASYLAIGCSLKDAVSKGLSFVHQAIFHAKDVVIGKGHGPLNHFFNPQKLIKNELV